VKANPYCSNLQVKNPCDLLRVQFFHIVKNQDHSQGRWYPQDCLMEEMMLFTVDGSMLWAAVWFDKEAPQFLVVRDQIVKRELSSICLGGTSPQAVAAVSGHGVKPRGQSVGTIEFTEMLKRSKEDLLRCVLRILTMAAHLHAE